MDGRRTRDARRETRTNRLSGLRNFMASTLHSSLVTHFASSFRSFAVIVPIFLAFCPLKAEIVIVWLMPIS